MGINTLLKKAPWENSERLTLYHESFLYEQRLLSLAVLFLLGEEYVPKAILNTMSTKYRDQVRNSVNSAVFSRALKNHFRQVPSGEIVANQMLRRMESYVNVVRDTKDSETDVLEAITMTLAKRVPPQSSEQLEQYQNRVGKIINFTETLVNKSLTKKYTIVEL